MEKENKFNLMMLGRKFHDCRTYCDYLRSTNIRRSDRLYEGNEEQQISSMYDLYNSLINKSNELLKKIVRFESILLQKKDFSKGSKLNLYSKPLVNVEYNVGQLLVKYPILKGILKEYGFDGSKFIYPYQLEDRPSILGMAIVNLNYTKDFKNQGLLDEYLKDYDYNEVVKYIELFKKIDRTLRK